MSHFSKEEKTGSVQMWSAGDQHQPAFVRCQKAVK